MGNKRSKKGSRKTLPRGEGEGNSSSSVRRGAVRPSERESGPGGKKGGREGR